MIPYTQRLRNRFKRMKGEDRGDPYALILEVQGWLNRCAVQAENDGHGAASEVLEKLAEHLEQGTV